MSDLPATPFEVKSGETEARLKAALKESADGGQQAPVKLFMLFSVYGEVENCDGVLEEIIEPPEGGTFVKLLGCSYLYKGYPNAAIVHGLELSKEMVSGIPRVFISRSWLIRSVVVWMYLFQRKKTLYLADHWFTGITYKVLRHIGMPYQRFNKFPKELMRATDIALKWEFNLPADEQLVKHFPEDVGVYYKPKQLAVLIAKVSVFAAFLIEYDCAYRFRFQDAFGHVDNSLARENGVKEFFRLFDILIEREAPEGISGKWRFLRKIFQVVFFTSPRARRIVQQILIHLNAENVKMDESDWYFCLKRYSYNFGGKTREWRYAERERIDKEKGHKFPIVKYLAPGEKPPVESKDVVKEPEPAVQSNA